MNRIFVTVALGLGLWLPLTAHALPARFSKSVVIRGLYAPTAMAFLPDGRVLVAEQAGTLRLIDHSQLQTTPYLTVRTTATGERGLLGVAVDPNFNRNHYVYVYYTVPGTPAHNRVRRFTQSSSNANIAQTGSGATILDLDPLSSATNHNGGAIHFSSDGKLFVGVGENANSSNAQSLGTRLGKILRLNADGSIPADNPLLSRTTGKNQAIWAYGLRNPFTFAFDPVSHELFINDVGQNAWEEVNRGHGGANYGWPTCEGTCSISGLTNPIYQYAHNGRSAAMTGATFYRRSLFPTSYLGNYFFGDYLQNIIRRREPNGRVTTFDNQAAGVVDLQVGSNGKLYYLSITEGKLYRVGYN